MFLKGQEKYTTCIKKNKDIFLNLYAHFGIKICFAQKPTFFAYIIIFLLFFSRINMKKKWESGQKHRKTA